MLSDFSCTAVPSLYPPHPRWPNGGFRSGWVLYRKYLWRIWSSSLDSTCWLGLPTRCRLLFFFSTLMMCNFCGLQVTVFKRLVHVKILCGPPVIWMQLECLEVGGEGRSLSKNTSIHWEAGSRRAHCWHLWCKVDIYLDNLILLFMAPSFGWGVSIQSLSSLFSSEPVTSVLCHWTWLPVVQPLY